MKRLHRSTWNNDSYPHSPLKSCGLSVINPQGISRVALLVSRASDRVTGSEREDD